MTTTPTAPPKQPYSVEQYLDEYQQAIDDLSGHYLPRVLAVYAAWQAGSVITPGWAAHLAGVMMRLVGEGIGVGAGLSARFLWFTRDLNPYDPDHPVSFDALPVDLAAEVERVTKATQTLAAELDNPTDNTPMTTRLERLVVNETAANIARGAQASGELVGVDGYVRGREPDACQLCDWLWKDGYVYPITKPMHRHTGCRCAPIPTERNAR